MAELREVQAKVTRADHEHAGAAECDDGTLVLPAAVSLVVSVKVQLLHEGEQTGEAVFGNRLAVGAGRARELRVWCKNAGGDEAVCARGCQLNPAQAG